MTELLTADQAAARLNMSERTLRKLRQSGEIAYIALTDRMFRYTPEDCDNYLAARRRKDDPCPSVKTHARRIGNMTSKGTNKGFMALLAAGQSGTRKNTKATSKGGSR